MNTHELKTDPLLFEKSLLGLKPFEIRVNDRCFKEGDILILRETDISGEEIKKGKKWKYTGRYKKVIINYILSGYGLKTNWVVMAVRDLI